MSFLTELSSALGHAQSHHGGANEEDNSLFSSALSMLDSRKDEMGDPGAYDVDEERYMRAHGDVYGGDGAQHDSDSVGTGAAMQALKLFMSSDGGGEGGGGGGMDKNRFIGMAMAQAGRVWEEKNESGSVSGDKQSAVNSAAEAAFKMYMKSQMGLGGTGGPSGLMGLASKFM